MYAFNPCVLFSAECETRILHQDLPLLFSPENLAIWRGPFGVAIRFLSLHLKTLFAFAMRSSLVGSHWSHAVLASENMR
jgi:hypothetical protein